MTTVNCDYMLPHLIIPSLPSQDHLPSFPFLTYLLFLLVDLQAHITVSFI
jgi:hypothetical protein